jgi:hypothetical protein
MSSVPVVGAIWNPPSYLPPFTQPGGIGTATFPAQQTGELVGQWTAGCGHSFQVWNVASVTIAGVQTAVVQCPYCSYVQELISPYDAIYTWPFEIIMG